MPWPPGGPSRLAGVKENPVPSRRPGPALPVTLGFGPGAAVPDGVPLPSVTVTHQVVLGFRAAAGARSRASHGSTGPRPDSSPGRSARPVRVASGTVRVTRLANPAGTGCRPGRACPCWLARPSGGAGGAGVVAEEQVQERAGAELVHVTLQPGGHSSRPPSDPLVRGQHLGRRQLAAHQGAVAGILAPPLHPGVLRRGLSALPGLLRGDVHHGALDRGPQPARVSRPARPSTSFSAAGASSALSSAVAWR